MSADESKDVVYRYFEKIWNKGDLDAVGEILAGMHWFTTRDGAPRRICEVAHQRVAEERRVFPDLHVAVDEIFVAGDRVVARWIMRGTPLH